MPYIVLHRCKAVLASDSYRDTPKGGVLIHGNTATVFNSYGAAQSAILRTNAYAKEHGLPWGEHRDYDIVRLTEYSESRKPALAQS